MRAQAASSYMFFPNVQFKVQKYKETPTVTFYSTQTANTPGKVYDVDNGVERPVSPTQPTINPSSQCQLGGFQLLSAGPSAASILLFNWTAEADF
jgi:hypothetical protein